MANKILTRRKQVKSELIVSTFCCTVERIEKDVYEKLFSIIERTTVYVWFPKNNSQNM